MKIKRIFGIFRFKEAFYRTREVPGIITLCDIRVLEVNLNEKKNQNCISKLFNFSKYSTVYRICFFGIVADFI